MLKTTINRAPLINMVHRVFSEAAYQSGHAEVEVFAGDESYTPN
jgi:hypothetical protein